MRLHKHRIPHSLRVLACCLVFLTLPGTPGRSSGTGSAAPWERQYKIKPAEKVRLTPADVVGPDGIVYPNWTKCGVQAPWPNAGGGIPDVKPAAKIEDFDGKPGDDADDSQALAKACEAAGKNGGGAVLLADGVYYLDQPVTVRYDNVVI